MGSVGRLVLAADELGYHAGEATERNSIGVYHVPVVTDVRRRGGEGLHVF
jgi:hypothetical protein